MLKRKQNKKPCTKQHINLEHSVFYGKISNLGVLISLSLGQSCDGKVSVWDLPVKTSPPVNEKLVLDACRDGKDVHAPLSQVYHFIRPSINTSRWRGWGRNLSLRPSLEENVEFLTHVIKCIVRGFPCDWSIVSRVRYPGYSSRITRRNLTLMNGEINSNERRR